MDGRALEVNRVHIMGGLTQDGMANILRNTNVVIPLKFPAIQLQRQSPNADIEISK